MSYSIWPGDLDFSAQAEQSRRSVARKRRPAELSARSDVAQIAILLQAETATLAPQQRLVVPQAARVEAEIAADRTHVAQHRRGNRFRRLVQHRVVFGNERRVLNGAECG